MKMAIFYLTCDSDEEADKVSQVLLEMELIACAKKLPVESMFRWKGSLQEDDEVLVMFESIEENFDKVNAEIKKLHSYETYVFFSIPVGRTTPEVEKWLKETVK
jgi:periplasmic divalent cation tolerance protein